MTKTEQKRAAIARLRELLHTMSTTEHDLWRLSVETLQTLVERVEHAKAASKTAARERQPDATETVTEANA